MNKRAIYFIIIFFMIITHAVSAAQTKIEFEVSFTEPQTHYAEIKMHVSGFNKPYIDIKMPVWTPGSYLVREFAKSVEAVMAGNSSGQTFKVQKLNKNTWRINCNKSDFTVSYRVYAFEISVRTAFVDASHAFLSPAGVFMFMDGKIDHPVTIVIRPYSTWSKVSTGLEPVAGKANTFYAANFDILFDSPIEIGNQDIFEFDVTGVHYEVAMYGGGNYDKERLKRDMAKVIARQTAVFGENPNKRYVFIVHNYNAGSGGLEHLNSTVLGVPRFNYGNDAGYLNFLRLAAHEHFHLWNVKRLRPKALGPFDYENENYTTNLWIAEGFTSYYDKLTVYRAGFQTAEKYLEALLADMAAVDNQPGNKVQPISEASFDAWIKYYRPTENTKNTTISYYIKGSLVAMITDLGIINATKAQKSLDDVMKSMYNEYYIKQKRGYTDAEFKAMIEKVAGKSFNQMYTDYVNGTKPIDYDTYFGYAGLSLVNDNAGKSQAYLGIAADVRAGKTMVSNVARGSAAYYNGINVNDEIIAIDGIRIEPVESPGLTEIEKIITTKKVGDNIAIIVARDGILQTIPVTLKANPNVKYKLVAKTTVSPEQYAVRKRWLNL